MEKIARARLLLAVMGRTGQQAIRPIWLRPVQHGSIRVQLLMALIFGGIFEGLIKFGTEHLLEDDSNPAYFFSKYVRALASVRTSEK
jgi:hypothetical protein